jgi:hypothetical protein
MNDEVAPIPFPRGTVMPLRMDINPPADGFNPEVSVTITNDLQEPFPHCRIILLMPAEKYTCSKGYIESAFNSDCNRFTKLVIRIDVPSDCRSVINVYKEI